MSKLHGPHCAAQTAVRTASAVRHLHFATPLVVKMNGKIGEGVIIKPA